jgi:hypothetical protein
MKSIAQIAAAMYEAYRATAISKGAIEHFPLYENIGEAAQSCWVAAAERARTEIQNCH